MTAQYTNTHNTTSKQARDSSISKERARALQPSPEAGDSYFPPVEELQRQGRLCGQKPGWATIQQKTPRAEAPARPSPAPAKYTRVRLLGAETPTGSPTRLHVTGTGLPRLTAKREHSVFDFDWDRHWLDAAAWQRAVEEFPPLKRQPGRRGFDQTNHQREGKADEEKESTSSRRQRPTSITIPPQDFSPPVVVTEQSTWRADPPTARRYSELLIDSMLGELRREAARWRQVELGFTPAAEFARGSPEMRVRDDADCPVTKAILELRRIYEKQAAMQQQQADAMIRWVWERRCANEVRDATDFSDGGRTITESMETMAPQRPDHGISGPRAEGTVPMIYPLIGGFLLGIVVCGLVP